MNMIILKLNFSICDVQSKQFLTWFQVHWSSVKYEYQCPQIFTNLMIRSYLGHETVVKLLLKKGAELESKDEEYDRTPLIWAAKNGHERVVKLLLEKGADLESRDEQWGQTPLSWAAENGHEGVVKLLLEKAVNVHSKDCYGQTPLSRAAENGHEAIVKLLLGKAAEKPLAIMPSQY